MAQVSEEEQTIILTTHKLNFHKASLNSLTKCCFACSLTQNGMLRCKRSEHDQAETEPDAIAVCGTTLLSITGMSN